MMVISIGVGLVVALTGLIVIGLQIEFEMPWLIAASMTLPLVIAGIALAHVITMLTDVPALYVAAGLGVLLYLLAGGYDAITKPQ